MSALAVTGMVGAYAYSQVDEPTSTAGAAARSFKAAVTGVRAPPVTNPLLRDRDRCSPPSLRGQVDLRIP